MSIYSIFAPISTALLPNAEKDDIFLVLRLFLPWNWNKWANGKEIGNLENKFKEYFGIKYAVSFSSGRAGLYAILSVIARPSADGRSNLPSNAPTNRIASSFLKVVPRNDNKSEVILQAYTTIALSLAIQKAGFKPIYADIEEHTYNINPDKIEAKITPKTKVIIVQHTFGIPAEMDKIIEICKKHKLLLIEDCAHSLGAEFNGKKVGIFGDAAFFSFGRDKIISSTSGGMVIVNNDKLAEKIKKFQSNLPFPPQAWIFRQLAHPLIFWCSLPIYYFLNLGKTKIFLNQKLGLITRAYGKNEKQGITGKNFGWRLPNALAILALNQFDKLERFNEHRISLAEFYKKKLASDLIQKPEFPKNAKATPLYYTIQAEKRDELLKFAAKNHIILGDWFPGALGPRGVKEEKFGYKKGDCPVAEKVGGRSLNLPTNIKTSEEDAEKVIDLIKQFYDNRRNYR